MAVGRYIDRYYYSSFGSSETAYCRDIFLYLSATAGGDISKNFCGQILEYVPTVVRNPVLMGFFILPKLKLFKFCKPLMPCWQRLFPL